jgi:hypothetical protein
MLENIQVNLDCSSEMLGCNLVRLGCKPVMKEHMREMLDCKQESLGCMLGMLDCSLEK